MSINTSPMAGTEQPFLSDNATFHVWTWNQGRTLFNHRCLYFVTFKEKLVHLSSNSFRLAVCYDVEIKHNQILL